MLSKAQASQGSAIRAAFAFLLLSFAALMADAQTLPGLRTLDSSQLPTALYHWTDSAGLAKLEKSLQQGSPLFGHVRAKHRLGSAFPSLVDRPALYAWTDPTTGIGTTTEEIYPSRKGAQPELVRLTMRPDARVVEITSEGLDFEITKLSAAEQSHLQSADVILHRWNLDGDTVLREWIVMDPGAVLEYETDPSKLKSDVEKSWKQLPERLKNPEKLHWSLKDGLIEEICLVCHEPGREIVRELLNEYEKPRIPARAKALRGAPLCRNIFFTGTP